jgi:hypothetical protein
MIRSKFVLVFAVGIAVGVLSSRSPLPAPVSAQPAGVKSTHWEYGELSSLPKGKNWSIAGKTVSAASWEELMKKMGIKGDTHFVALLNRIGAEGWELATHSATSINNSGVIVTSEYWTFKRLVK